MKKLLPLLILVTCVCSASSEYKRDFKVNYGHFYYIHFKKLLNKQETIAEYEKKLIQMQEEAKRHEERLRRHEKELREFKNIGHPEEKKVLERLAEAKPKRNLSLIQSVETFRQIINISTNQELEQFIKQQVVIIEKRTTEFQSIITNLNEKLKEAEVNYEKSKNKALRKYIYETTEDIHQFKRRMLPFEQKLKRLQKLIEIL